LKCELILGDTWHETVDSQELSRALAFPNFYERIKRTVDLYAKAVETLAGREPHPSMVLCCLPQDVIDYCTVRATRGGEVRRVRLAAAEREAMKAARRGQQFLFREFAPTLELEDAEPGHRNLRRGVKAKCMQFGIPTQIVWPATLDLSDPGVSPTVRHVQDPATRAWNLMTGLYHKGGGVPWRLAQTRSGVCFVGVSFYKETWDTSQRIRTAMAQLFTAAGDGYVLRGNSFEWDESRPTRTPHLDRLSARDLMRDVLALYERQSRGSLPNRVVVHKTSRYWDEELAGFREGCQRVPHTDFVALGQRDIQLYRPGDYPAIRGTYVKFSETELLLYTTGYIPFLCTYPGARVPQPLGIIEHIGDSPWNVVLDEILALTKINWNSADFCCARPITVHFSRRVGDILAELPPGFSLRPEYRFYM